MEQWQREHIVKNLCDLMENIDCNIKLLSHLRQFGVLSAADINKLKAVGKSEGDDEKNNVLLEIIITRTKGYEHLAKALFQCRQTGALLKLLEGYNTNHADTNPLELCEIELNVDEILAKEVIFGGNKILLKDVCKDINSELLPKLITSAMDATTYGNLISEETIELSVDTLPQLIPYYIPRTVSINLQLDPKIIDSLETDIFCVEGIELYQLSSLANRKDYCTTDKSRNQIHVVTARFILLEHHDHFQEIVDKTQKSVHWIKHDNDNFFYVRCSNGNHIQTIQKFLISASSQQLSEDDLLLQSQNGPRNAAVLLYDSPGMGKSVLLTRLAQKTKNNHPKRSAIFLQTIDLISKVRQVQQEVNSFVIMQALVKSITTNSFGKNITKTLFGLRNHQIELFLDAYDEVPEGDLGCANIILNVIAKECHNIRMYITTRRHKYGELEKKFGMLGYNILPFDHSNKLSFFQNYWQSEYGVEMTDETNEFAEHCLKTVSLEASNGEGDISGIPLQCRMVADIYAKHAKSGALIPTESQFQLSSIFEVYQRFIDTKFSTFFSDEEDRQMYYNFHVKASLCLLFPEKCQYLEEIHVPDDELIYRIGILGPLKSDSSTFIFSHRTLAEYFAGNALAYSSTSKLSMNLTEGDFIELFFQHALSADDDSNKTSFSYPVVCSFLNFHLSTLNPDVANDVAIKIALRGSKHYNSETFIGLLEGCLRINAIHLYLLLLDFFFDLDESNFNTATTLKFKENLQETQNWKAKKLKKLELVNDLKEDEKFPKLASIAARHSSLNLVKLSCELLESVTGQKVHEIPYDKESSPMYFALQRGHYQIFEYLLSFNREKCYEQPVLHWCLDNSYGRNVGDKVQIVKMILHERPDLLNQVAPEYFNEVPLLAFNANFLLIKYLIEEGADLTQITELKETLAHKTAQYFSAEEYHELVKIIISRKAQMLFKQRDFVGFTAVHRALGGIDLKNETLELLANSCKVNFNETFPVVESVFSYAVMKGRDERVIKDMIRLGGDKDQLKERAKQKFSIYYNL